MYVCIHTNMFIPYLELTPQLLILLLVFLFCCLFIKSNWLLFFYVLSCLTEIPTLTKNTHTYSIENCGSILTSFSFILSILEYFIYHFKNKKKKVKDEVTTFLYYKLTSTQSSSIVHHWC